MILHRSDAGQRFTPDRIEGKSGETVRTLPRPKTRPLRRLKNSRIRSPKECQVDLDNLMHELLLAKGLLTDRPRRNANLA